MQLKKIGKAFLFPPVAILIMLLPISVVLLVYSMVFLGTESPVAIISYVLAFYTLTIGCLRIPYLIRFVKAFKEDNKYARRWLSDTRLRINVSLYGSLIWNTAYAVFQLGLGFWHHTFWFYSLAGYYIALAVMRFFLVRHSRKYEAGERMLEELRKYRTCGIIFLIMNLALAFMIFFMVYWNRTFNHHEITTIALATYTFISLAKAIINVHKYRRYNSPVYSATKAISLASACVSMLTLESTMLTTFGDGSVDLVTRRILLGTSGGVISVFIIVMAIFMIVQGTKKIKQLRAAEEQKMDNMNNMDNKTETKDTETFTYTYSAKEQDEIKAIRKKYASPEETEDKMARLRRLDAGVTKKATAVSLAVGIVGALVLGFGMSLAMTEIGDILPWDSQWSLLGGSAVGIVGIGLVSLAYPLYNRIVKKEREKLAPEILRLTDELMK